MRSMSKSIVVVAVGLAGLVVGCAGSGRGSIQIVRQHDTGGEIALTGPVVAAHYAAEDAMLDHCQGRVRITSIQRGGTTGGAEAQTKLGEPAIDPGAERVHYECVSRTARLRAGR